MPACKYYWKFFCFNAVHFIDFISSSVCGAWTMSRHRKNVTWSSTQCVSSSATMGNKTKPSNCLQAARKIFPVFHNFNIKWNSFLGFASAGKLSEMKSQNIFVAEQFYAYILLFISAVYSRCISCLYLLHPCLRSFDCLLVYSPWRVLSSDTGSRLTV